MSYNVEQIKKIWNQLSDTEKKEFTAFLFDNSKKSLREGFESFSVNRSTTMQFGDVNVCPACGK